MRNYEYSLTHNTGMQKRTSDEEEPDTTELKDIFADLRAAYPPTKEYPNQVKIRGDLHAYVSEEESRREKVPLYFLHFNMRF